MIRRYVVLMHDGISNGMFLPDAPSADNTVDSLAAARDMFRDWMRASGNDYHRADGYGAPSATVYPSADYDGIAYGDYPYAAFERGPRGGIVDVAL